MDKQDGMRQTLYAAAKAKPGTFPPGRNTRDGESKKRAKPFALKEASGPKA